MSHNDDSGVPLVNEVDTQRFTGKWFVHGNIPTFPERNAYNSVEQYELEKDGDKEKMKTTFTYQNGGFDKSVSTAHPTGFPDPEHGNALWGMQFVWPFKAEYKVSYLAPDYSTVIIARSKKDYVWLMTRSPSIEETDYKKYSDLIASWGYDVTKMRRVPQQPAGQRADGN